MSDLDPTPAALITNMAPGAVQSQMGSLFNGGLQEVALA